MVDSDFRAGVQVFHENLFHAGGCFLSIDESVGLEVIFKTAEVHVGRTDGAPIIVGHGAFAV